MYVIVFLFLDYFASWSVSARKQHLSACVHTCVADDFELPPHNPRFPPTHTLVTQDTHGITDDTIREPWVKRYWQPMTLTVSLIALVTLLLVPIFEDEPEKQVRGNPVHTPTSHPPMLSPTQLALPLGGCGIPLHPARGASRRAR
jgi:hypothetical protein